MNVDDGTVRELLTIPEHPELAELQEREIEITREQTERILELRKQALCTSCGKQMAGNGRAVTGTCSDCLFKQSAANLANASRATGRLMSRRERRAMSRGR